MQCENTADWLTGECASMRWRGAPCVHPITTPSTHLPHHLQRLCLREVGVPQLVKHGQHEVGACRASRAGRRREPMCPQHGGDAGQHCWTGRHAHLQLGLAPTERPNRTPKSQKHRLTVSRAADVHAVQRSQVVTPVERGARPLIKASHQQVGVIWRLQGWAQAQGRIQNEGTSSAQRM